VSAELDDSTWWEYATCRSADPKIFEYPKSNRGTQLRGARSSAFPEARALCGTCPVQRHCLDDALRKHPPELGGYDMFQAGYTPVELEGLLKRVKSRG
jgi:hypothetical protein